MVGVISNIAALSAKTNLNQASSDSQSSIYRLSSGKAIAQSSDNVAGLAIGTILQTNVSTLKTSLSNTAQATSLLGVADGALANIGDILQRQKSLATQAISGSLSNQARSFLNQEFQSLKSEVDRISGTTNFNGINLIDGSLYGPNTVQTYTRSNATYATGQLIQTAPMAAGSTLLFNSPIWGAATFTYDTTANIAAAIGGGHPDKALLYIDVTQNTTVASQMAVLYNNIQNILNYGGTESSIISAKASLNRMSYSSDSATYLNITSNFAGAAAIPRATSSSGGTFQMNTTAMGAGVAKNITTGITQPVNGDLSAGAFITTNVFSENASATATGSIGDSILASVSTATSQAATGVDATLVCNNPAFIGKIQGFTATYQGPNQVTAQITVGGITYTANSINTNASNGWKISFVSNAGAGGLFALKMAANMTVSNQTDANLFAARLNKAFSTVTFEQNRIMSNFIAAGSVYGTPGAAATGNLAASQVNIIHSNFDNLQVQNVTVTPPVLGGTTSTIAVQINGETYVSGYNSDGTVATAGLDGATSGTTITQGHTIGLVSTTNPNHIIQFKYGGGGATNLDISTAANAQAFQVALANAFGVNLGSTSLSFQVGTIGTDSIGVQIKNSNSNSIYVDNYGVSQASTIAIDNINNAITASAILDNAINAVTAIRANVGALESRFNYASSNLTTSIQNQDAARSTFLDTNVTAESTNFAQSQVKVQTALSVLAQANQLPESLLKLIGG